MSQVLPSCFQGLLDLLNFVLQPPLRLGEYVCFSFDPLVFVLEPRSFGPLLSELELKWVDGGSRYWVASEILDKLDILVCCLSVPGRYAGTEPPKNLSHGERHVSGDGEREQGGIPWSMSATVCVCQIKPVSKSALTSLLSLYPRKSVADPLFLYKMVNFSSKYLSSNPSLLTVMPITRSPYKGTSRKLLLAFDIGTTYSGVCYAFLDPGVVPEVQPVTT